MFAVSKSRLWALAASTGLLACAAPARAEVILSGTAEVVASPGGNPSGNPNVWQLQTTDSTYGALTVPVDSAFTLSGLTELSATYLMTEGDFGGGSPRFSIGLDVDGNGSEDKYLFVYFGDHPNFNNTPPADWSTFDALAQLSVDSGQLPGGTFYDSWANANANYGSYGVTSISLVLDGGWLQDQTLLVDTFSINGEAAAAPVPEPATLAVFGALGLTAFGVRRRKARA